MREREIEIRREGGRKGRQVRRKEDEQKGREECGKENGETDKHLARPAKVPLPHGTCACRGGSKCSRTLDKDGKAACTQGHCSGIFQGRRAAAGLWMLHGEWG